MPEISKVSGVTFEGRQEILGQYYAEMAENHTHLGRIVREPENPHDPNACAVYIGDHQIGYLPKDTARTLALYMRECHVSEIIAAVLIDVSGEVGWGISNFFARVAYELPVPF